MVGQGGMVREACPISPDRGDRAKHGQLEWAGLGFEINAEETMFSGLVEALGQVVEITESGPGKRLVIEAGIAAEGAKVGDSIANNGCCLTVVEVSGSKLAFEAGPETLLRTSLGDLQLGGRVNLERSLQLSDRIGGHLVTGHVDGLGHLEQRIDEGDWSTFWFRIPTGLYRQMASKGSITVDGVSLTLVDVEQNKFSVALIPHTLQVTTLGQLQVGDSVNLETDLLAKYVQQQLEAAGTISQS